jgi:GxxExxY protein
VRSGFNSNIMTTQKEINQLSRTIIGYAIDVHKELGPGLLESIYEKCLAHLLIQNGYSIARQQVIPLNFRGLNLDCELRFDMLVNDLIIVELKTVDELLPIHEAQLLTYLKLLRKPKGILINFNCLNIFKDGQKTFVTEYFRALPEE